MASNNTSAIKPLQQLIARHYQPADAITAKYQYSTTELHAIIQEHHPDAWTAAQVHDALTQLHFTTTADSDGIRWLLRKA